MRPQSLTEGSISRGLIFFALPILYGTVLQSLNGSVNSIWVGRFLGEAALTATTNANTLLFLLLSAAFGLSMATTILIGQHFGSRQVDMAKRVAGTSATFFAVLSLAVTTVGWLACEPLLRLMRTPADALPLAVSYMRVIFLGLPFIFMNVFMSAALRGAGDSKTPFYFLLLNVVLDIVLNPVFIFGLGPLPALAVAGSALAMLVAQAISLTALITYAYRNKHVLCLHRDELKLLRMDGSIVGPLVRKGVPMGLQMLVMSFSGVLMISLVNRFGVDTSAAYAAAFQIWHYVQMPSIALGLAVSTFAAQNVGAGLWDRVAKTARVGVAYGSLFTGSLVVILELFSRPVLSLFLPPDSPALAIGEHLNSIVAMSFVFFGVTFVLFGVVRATGAVVAPLLILTFTLLVVRFGVAWLLLDTFRAEAIWWSFPLTSAISALLAVLYYKFGGWRSARMAAPASYSTRASA